MPPCYGMTNFNMVPKSSCCSCVMVCHTNFNLGQKGVVGLDTMHPCWTFTSNYNPSLKKCAVFLTARDHVGSIILGQLISLKHAETLCFSRTSLAVRLSTSCAWKTEVSTILSVPQCLGHQQRLDQFNWVNIFRIWPIENHRKIDGAC